MSHLTSLTHKKIHTGDNLIHKIIELSRGELSLSYNIDENSTYTLDELLDFAERINPKRAFLFVSKVLGRHIPVSPFIMRQAFSDLAEKLPPNLPEPILVVGMAETAVGLSAGVHHVLQQRFPHAVLLNSTRHAQDGELFTTFSEDHSHASTHLIYKSEDKSLQNQVQNAKTLIMVDDEASTGNTCKNLVRGLRDAGLNKLTEVHLLTLVDWSLSSLQHKIEKKNDGNLISETITKTDADPQVFCNGIMFFRHHLLAGSWQWQDKPNDIKIDMPKVDITEAGEYPILETGDWGRFPTLNSSQGLSVLQDNLCQQVKINDLFDKNVLVLGSNEFVWLPFLLAEWLSEQGSLVKFSALTRSPIALGSAITHKLSFQDNYGLGITNFVYNVNPDDWDVVLLCIETAKDSIDPIWHTFDNLILVSPE